MMAAGMLQMVNWRSLLIFYLMLCVVEAGNNKWNLTYNVLHLSRSKSRVSGSPVYSCSTFGTDSAHARIVHRDSMPWRRNVTREERTQETMLRDEARLSAIHNHIKNNNNHINNKRAAESVIYSGLRLDTGEYLAVVGVGTPRVDVSLVVDTGSDITWLQCKPCSNCYHQKEQLFDPTNSSSYRALHCDNAICLNLDVMGCVANKCQYQTDYGDGSFTNGDFALENVELQDASTLGSSSAAKRIIFNNIPFGCGHDNEGVFGMAAGILGLGRGPLAFTNYVNGYGTAFSYCFPDREGDSSERSSLIFGDGAVPDRNSGGGVPFTPQLRNPRVATYYYVQVTGISVGGKPLTNIPPSSFHLDSHGNGGTILDSGTTVTRLQSTAYESLRDAFRDATQHLTLVGKYGFFDTCYDLSGMDSISVPTVSFHFQGDSNSAVDMRLPPSNYLVPVASNDTYCLAFAATAGPSVIGNVQQQGFRVFYDNVNMQIGFLPNQC